MASHLPSLSVRPLGRADKPALIQHFLRLDEETRHQRFAAAVSDEFLIRHAVAAFRPGILLIGAFIGGKLRAVAEMRELDGAEAEAAFSVEAGFQDHGLGRALVEKLMDAAADRAIGRLHVICERENDRMRHLAQKYGREMMSLSA